MSFQSGEVFCSSHMIRDFPCQDTTNRTPELEFRVYHKMYEASPRNAIMGRTKNRMIREKVNVFMVFVSSPCGGDCTPGSLTVKQFCTQ